MTAFTRFLLGARRKTLRGLGLPWQLRYELVLLGPTAPIRRVDR